MSALRQIESVYGSVVEYNRLQEEKAADEYWNSLSEEQQLKEMDESVRRRNEHLEEVNALNIEPSELAKRVKVTFDAAVNRATDSYYERQDNYTSALKESMETIVSNYGQKINDDVSIYRDLEKNKFGIDYTYSDAGLVKHNTVLNLDKDTFLKMYADMYSIGGYIVKPAYKDEKEVHTVTGKSVGELRRNEFKRWNVPDPEGKAILDELSAKRAEQASNIIDNEEQMSNQLEFNN